MDETVTLTCDEDFAFIKEDVSELVIPCVGVEMFEGYTTIPSECNRGSALIFSQTD